VEEFLAKALRAEKALRGVEDEVGGRWRLGLRN
jgi:hypothetical protein